MSQRNSTLILAAVAALAGSSALHAQVVVNEDFTVNANVNPWYAFNGACLTASTVAGASSGTAGAIPGCVANQSSAFGGNAAQGTYYNEYLVGGYAGAAAYSEQLPDPSGHGALRLTNGPTLTGGSYVGGYNQNGAIISSVPFSSSAGVEVQFISVTYRGDSRTANPGTGDGADGMSFFLMDASVAPNFGSYGGSLGYTCSNNNPDYHGMIGAYLGLGIDEYRQLSQRHQQHARYDGYQPGAAGRQHRQRRRLSAQSYRPARRRQHQLEVAQRQLQQLLPGRNRPDRCAAECGGTEHLQDRHALELFRPGLTEQYRHCSARLPGHPECVQGDQQRQDRQRVRHRRLCALERDTDSV